MLQIPFPFPLQHLLCNVRCSTFAALLLGTGLLVLPARAEIEGFSDDFEDGSGLSMVWSEEGDPAGHKGIADGSYFLTDGYGAPGTKLLRRVESVPGSWKHEIEVVLDPFLGAVKTGTDFKWRSLGADGLIEIALNSFGKMRLYHNDFNGGAGVVQDPAGIDYQDGDILRLAVSYDEQTDTVSVAYSLNGGADVLFYTGGGIEGPLGDVIKKRIEAELYKFQDKRPAEQAVLGIRNWSLSGGSATGD